MYVKTDFQQNTIQNLIINYVLLMTFLYKFKRKSGRFLFFIWDSLARLASTVKRRSIYGTEMRCNNIMHTIQLFTDLLVLFVFLLWGVMGHAQDGDHKIQQSKDTVQPQKFVPKARRRELLRSCQQLHKHVHTQQGNAFQVYTNLLCRDINHCCSAEILWAISWKT